MFDNVGKRFGCTKCARHSAPTTNKINWRWRDNRIRFTLPQIKCWQMPVEDFSTKTFGIRQCEALTILFMHFQQTSRNHTRLEIDEWAEVLGRVGRVHALSFTLIIVICSRTSRCHCSAIRVLCALCSVHHESMLAASHNRNLSWHNSSPFECNDGV